MFKLAIAFAAAVDGILVHEPSLDLISPEREFSAFMQEHGRSYGQGSLEYHRRFAIFQQHKAAVHAQNSLPGKRWTAAVNSLADWTPEELKSLRGYRHGVRSSHASGGSLGLVSTGTYTFEADQLPKDFNWKHLNSMKDILNQGSCGSCWAVSSATTLRAHAELYNKDRTFSAQQIVACTPNPKKCGGSGGCGGATAELAMEYVAKAGALTEDELKYEGSDTKCPDVSEEKKTSLRSFLGNVMSLSDTSGSTTKGGSSFGMVGWKKLPENMAEPLLVALYQDGPVTVSVAASGQWNLYNSGIMDPCDKDAIINHAVVLVGYGDDKYLSAKYWTIQNSWGSSWGEEGFGRLSRLDSKEESAYCGWDTKPEEGTACLNGPSKVRVCGSCGILYDSVVPKFKLSQNGWLYKNGGRNTTA